MKKFGNPDRKARSSFLVAGIYYVVSLCSAVLVMQACSSMPSAPKADRFIESVYAKLEHGDLDGALALFNGLSPEDAAKSRNLLFKASILFSAGRLPERTQNAQKALENSTDTRERREAQFILSNIDGAEGRIKEQKERLNALVKANPRFIPAINAMGQIMLREKQFKAAGSYFDTALKISAQDLDALVGRAAVYRLERKPTEAVKRLSEAIAAHPGEVEPLAQRGRIFREMGKLKEALADLDQAKKLAGNDYWIAYDRGRTLLALDKKRDALAEFKRAEKINPSIFASYVYSAGINDELNDYNAAMHDYEALARIKPDYYFGLEMLGIHYMREKRYAAARDVFRQAHSVAPTAYNYALLSVINGLYAGDRPQQFKPYIEEIMRKIDRSKSEYSMMRLFYEFAGDSDVIRRIGAEKDLPTKAKNLFYLANYYEARGNNALAQKMFEEFRLLQRRETMEWRIYELVVESGSLKTVTVSTNDGGQS